MSENSDNLSPASSSTRMRQRNVCSFCHNLMPSNALFCDVCGSRRNRAYETNQRRILIGITGCTSIIIAIRLLQALREAGIERHLILSNAAKQTIPLETDYKVSEVEALGTQTYGFNDITAPPASGGLRTDGMVVIPCSMKSLAAIASGYGENLITRATEVTLKERRRLVIVPRETPFSAIDIENMLRIARAGAIVLPPMPAFYNRPKTVDDIINHVVGKVLDMFDIEHVLYQRWEGLSIFGK